MVGTDFQQLVWAALQDIPHGRTLSYAGLASAIEKPTACRAVARANSMNQLAIIIPCHRVINSGGGLGGYAGGVDRKAWLLQHEKTLAV
jgi:O-6-methylguanine DNA methyltransferase